MGRLKVYNLHFSEITVRFVQPVKSTKIFLFWFQENALQQCLAEIQKIAWDLNARLAESHAGLVNLSCRKKD